MKKIIFYSLLIWSLIINAQTKNIVTEPYYIKTIQLNNGAKPKPTPFVQLNHSVFLSFDDLQADDKTYYYKIIHCDENWDFSDLSESEYISGFNSAEITSMNSSNGTTQSYTHYNLQIPNEDTKILLSGNYIMQVLDEDDDIIFSRPFVIYTKKINIGIGVKWSNDVSNRDHYQIIDFSLYTQSFTIFNESEALSVRIFQNNDLNYYKEFHQPTFYKGNEWVYHYPHQSIFEGINEFRQFECKDLRGSNYGISYSELNNLYDFYVYEDNYRNHYLFYKDINGSFIINSLQANDNVETESDYVNVHFTFNNSIDANKRLFIIGRFNNYIAGDDYELVYNESTKKYEATVLLKQGYYNYMYVTKNSNDEIDIAEISGSYAETNNDYTVLVYYRPPGSRYTKVIGFATTTSEVIR